MFELFRVLYIHEYTISYLLAFSYRILDNDRPKSNSRRTAGLDAYENQQEHARFQAKRLTMPADRVRRPHSKNNQTK